MEMTRINRQILNESHASTSSYRGRYYQQQNKWYP